MSKSSHTPRLTSPARRQAVLLLAAATGAAGLFGALPAGAGEMAHDAGDGHVMHGALTIGNFWARPNLPNRPAAAYLHVMNGGAAADALTGVSSKRFGKIEMHATTEKDGMMHMQQVEAVEVPAGGVVALEPGGYHLMMFDAAEPLKEGETFHLTLTFRNAGPVMIEVPVMKRGPEGHDGHMQHKSD